MKSKKFVNILMILFFIITTPIVSYSQESNVGTKAFKLGLTKAKVQTIIAQKFASAKKENLTGGNLRVFPKSGIMVDLYFDNKNFLYLMDVKIDSDKDGASIKERLLSKELNSPNLQLKETYDENNKLFTVGKWMLSNGRYQVYLFDSIYSRRDKFVPGFIIVRYLDKQLLTEYNAFKSGNKYEKKSNADKSKYDF